MLEAGNERASHSAIASLLLLRPLFLSLSTFSLSFLRERERERRSECLGDHFQLSLQLGYSKVKEDLRQSFCSIQSASP